MSQKVPKYVGPYGDELDAAYDLFDSVIADFKATIEDGFQLADIVEWHGIATRSYDIAKAVFNEATEDKVIEVARYIYWAVDPDLPWIPEWIEQGIEKMVIVDIAIPMAVRAAFDAVEKYKATE